MKNNIYCLGIDTSNYTTSVALIDEEFNIIADSRKVLNVRRGERGLRQSQALFEHIGNLPEIFESLEIDVKNCTIAAVSVSEKPRNLEDSYMPVFFAGCSVGKSAAAVTGAKYYGYSHQEGHIEAAKHSSGYMGEGEFLSLHLSGGTTEVLRCREIPGGRGYSTEIVGGTKDISLGQLIDRVGVSLGMSFPCGKYMDEAARSKAFNDKSDVLKNSKNLFCKIKAEQGMLNISGIETQIQRYIKDNIDKDELTEIVSFELFTRIGRALKDIIHQTREITGVKPVVMAGGVASSLFIRKIFDREEDIYFGFPQLSSDNAVGIAMIGMKRFLTDETGTSFTG